MKKISVIIAILATFLINVANAQTEGIYYIRLANNNIMEAEGGTFRNNGCKIQIWERVNNVENQKWLLTKTPSGTFKIKNMGSGKLLDVHYPDVNRNGGKIQLWDEVVGNKNQEWVFQNRGSGRYTIKSAASTGNKVLAVTGAAVTAWGTAIQLWDYSTSNPTNQIWYLDRIGNVPVATCDHITVKLLSITSNDIHNGDCKRGYGTVDLELWEKNASGGRVRRIPASGAGVRLINWERGPVRNINNHRDGLISPNIENIASFFSFSPNLLTENKLFLVVKTNLGTAHKQADLAVDFTWEAKMTREQEQEISLRDIMRQPTPIKSIVCGPYVTQHPVHALRVHFSVEE